MKETQFVNEQENMLDKSVRKYGKPEYISQI